VPKSGKSQCALSLILALFVGMVRYYKRKTTRQSWTEQAMESAMHDVLQSGVAVRTAAREHNIPRNTLKRRVLNRNKQVLMQIINL